VKNFHPSYVVSDQGSMAFYNAYRSKKKLEYDMAKYRMFFQWIHYKNNKLLFHFNDDYIAKK
jgi:hypothetical protein